MKPRTLTLILLAVAAGVVIAYRRRKRAAATLYGGTGTAATIQQNPPASTITTVGSATDTTVFPLQLGSKGPEVKTIQTILRALHIHDEVGNDLQPDADWGPHTEYAAAKLPRFAYYRRDTLSALLGTQSAWHQPFADAVHTVSGHVTIAKPGYDAIVNFYNQNRRADGTMNLGATKIM